MRTEPMGSESTSFASIVENVRKTDPQKADILDKGLAELRQAKGDLPQKAKTLIGQL